MTNATISLVQPYAKPVDGEPLQRDHRDRTHLAERCWMTRTSESYEARVLGGMTRSTWVCRFKTGLPVTEGWRAFVQTDGDGEEYEYLVRSARKHFTAKLILERVG